jgi:excisionase family DNA binding protein
MRADLLQRDPALSLAEAAVYLSVHPVELRGMARRREIAVIRRGPRGHMRFRLSELNRYLERLTTPARRQTAGE